MKALKYIFTILLLLFVVIAAFNFIGSNKESYSDADARRFADIAQQHEDQAVKLEKMAREAEAKGDIIRAVRIEEEVSQLRSKARKFENIARRYETYARKKRNSR